ncbi:plexin-B-like [Tetranychus urticae]|uniref:plexin-B-like n=1 Tax=Tetranychus urticae TaxID=32264 RepID=UPI00077C0274|nr:plexin-B-like [Tetranychus urticae]
MNPCFQSTIGIPNTHQTLTIFLWSILMASFLDVCLTHRSHHYTFFQSDSPSPSNVEPPIYASYTTPNKSINFTHLVVDPVTGRLYIGATNWIYQFSDDLSLEVSQRTGPIDDSPYCSPSDCSAVESVAIKATNNVNKVLLLDPESRMLIACGSVRQGSCRRHRMDDISRAESLIEVPVAANDENSSTVAFVGPAFYYGEKGESVLYVAATYTRLGPYRELVPAISSRSLEPGPRLFTIIEKSFTDSGRVDISSHLRDYFLVKYVTGFASGDFVYFAAVQRKSSLRALEEWGYVSRLGRVCASDAGFHSYSEITISCIDPHTGIDYNLLSGGSVVRAGHNLIDSYRLPRGTQVFIGAFVSSRDHTTRPSAHSAICIFPLPLIEAKFAENIHLCYNGSVLSRNMDYIAGSVNECPETGRAGNILNFCNEAVKLNGTLPLTSKPVITYNNTTLTGITVTTNEQHTIAFLGTSSGHLKKVLISSYDAGHEFEQIVVDKGNPIIKDIHLDHTHKFVITATPYKVAKVKVERCQHYNSCSSCLNSHNPYCGWCSLERRCTSRSDCDDNSNWSLTEKIFTSPRWLPLGTSQCIEFEEVRPNSLPFTAISNVELYITQLPPSPYPAAYLCLFGDSSTPLPARQTHTGLSCRTPPIEERPSIPPGKDHVLINLSVRSTVTQKDFISKPFVYYECSVHKTCRSCVKAKWPCNWCIQDNQCTHNGSLCSGHHVLSNENPSIGSSSDLSSEYCPSFRIDHEILIPNGAKREITIHVQNFGNQMANLECIIEIEGARARISARLKGDRIICAPNMYTYQSDVGKMYAQLSVLWDGDTLIDKTNVTLYKCDLLGSHLSKPDCSLCQTSDRKYQCVWCSGSCSFVDACMESPAPSCPPPRIDLIYPLSGPIEGGTLVTIKGSNLGSSVDEIKDKVAIGGIPCTPVEYNVSVRVVCRTGPSPTGPYSANIVVGNRAGVTRANENFVYKAVQLMDVNPKVGPQSGGTHLYLAGSNFNIGSNIEIYLDDMPCDIKKSMIANRQVTCRTSPSLTAPYWVQKLTLLLDGANLTLPRPYTYGKDPTIHSIYPNKSYISGGRLIYVTGNHLSFIAQPRMIIKHSSRIIGKSLCLPVNDTLIKCPAPSIKPYLESFAGPQATSSSSSMTAPSSETGFDSSTTTSNEYSRLILSPSHHDLPRSDHLHARPHLHGHSSHAHLIFEIAFEMDSVESVTNVRDNFPSVDSSLHYVPDPVFRSFDNDGIKLYTGESLVIDGDNLRLAASETDVNVTIGNRPCNLTSLTMNQLVCLPPTEAYAMSSYTDLFGRSTETNLPVVVVAIGNNIRKQVGFLRYDANSTHEVPFMFIGLTSAAGLLLLLFSLAILAFIRNRSSNVAKESVDLKPRSLGPAIGSHPLPTTIPTPIYSARPPTSLSTATTMIAGASCSTRTLNRAHADHIYESIDNLPAIRYSSKVNLDYTYFGHPAVNYIRRV